MTKRVKLPYSVSQLILKLPYPVRLLLGFGGCSPRWFAVMYPRAAMLAAFAAGALTALAVVALNAHELYAWYWRVWVYQP